MSVLMSNDIINWLITAVIGFVTLYLVRFYYRVLTLPRGPIPLPVIGNILKFFRTKENLFLTINSMHKTYGPVFTFWLGNTPAIVVSDYKLIKEAFNSKDNELMGRPVTLFSKILTKNGKDVVFTDHGPIWASLRRLAHSAVRKLAISEKLYVLANDAVRETVDTIITTEGYDKPFNPMSYIYMSVINIIASSAFGKRYTFNDPELKFYENSLEYFRANTNTLGLCDRVPAMKLIYGKVINKTLDVVDQLSTNVKQQYLNRIPVHQNGVVNDFCDALIEAKHEAIAEQKDTAIHFTDTNLSLVIIDLFMAGIDTSQYMMRWIILFMANNIIMQNKMRDEKGITPLGAPHVAMCDTKMGKHYIKEGSFVMSNLWAISQDPELFDRPEEFNPNRFLSSNGTYKSSVPGFVPFGIGRRICLGEKLALTDLFYITVQLLQSTTQSMWTLPGGDGTVIGFVTLYLVRFYHRVLSLPRGPIPLPIMGNMMKFFRTKENQFLIINSMHKTYGPVFTIWLGTTPMVVVSDYKLSKEAFNSKGNELMGKPKTIFSKILLKDGKDVLFTDHGPVWASLRRLAHSAVRKLAVSEKFYILTNDAVRETVDTMIATEGCDKPFDPKSYIYMSVINIIASSAFGKRYKFNDPELKFYENSLEYFRENMKTLGLCDRVPAMKLFYKIAYLSTKMELSMISVTHLLRPKRRPLLNKKESASYFTDTNLSLVIMNLFMAGTDTTQYMMRWIILFMANNTKMQNKMRDEINDIIGDRMITHEDKNNCHYINAFIAETLRLRGITPLGSPHVAMCDTKIGEHNIKEGSFVAINIWTISRDSELWDKPEEFNPNRFLSSDGTYKSSVTGFIPFGIGRRICLGEKLALADLFFITVRLLQSTSQYILTLPGGDGSADLEPNPNVMFLNVPKSYDIVLKRK
ncbi:steroid 17-alpha-hydroxylase/17,20 lyase-like [Oppia nitens]|uniref:steroid 17-alpha-hydroxylase/17,20 lyase-like n=1 Tax=Oppia nitens TaxID=1686743 RepID=UPI0023D97B0D|nr:steroid 17-alpha-hydroxylase/17,20 lyase-like [Oppia nitens]